MKRFLILAISLAVLMSCEKVSGEKKQQDETPEIEKNKDFVPVSLTKAQESIRTETNSFAFNVFSALMEREAEMVGKNMMISPLSLSSALSMCVNGADGLTEEQMLQVMGYDGFTVDEMNSFYEVILDALVRADEKVDFLSANSIWHVRDIELYDSYKENISKVFSADVEEVDDFNADAVEKINEWCSKKTNGKIEKFIESDRVSGKVKLINALYFKGEWTDEFGKPHKKAFNHENGSVSQIETISDVRTIKYGEDENFQCVEIPYGNGAFVMDLILPSEDMSMKNAAMSLTAEVWDSLTQSMTEDEVMLEFPVFDIKYGKDLREILIELGMSSAFTVADFSKMSPTELLISQVLQKTYISVTEKGSEAAGVTDVTLEDSMAPEGDEGEKMTTFIADRPFFFIIRESSTGVILFMGKKS